MSRRRSRTRTPTRRAGCVWPAWRRAGSTCRSTRTWRCPPRAPGARPRTTRLDNRGKLLYKDYRDYGLLGSFTLQGPDWSIPSKQVFPYETGSKPGPYNVAGGSTDDIDKSLVLDFDLQAGQWAGFEIPVLPGQPLPDLSSIDALITEYKMLELSPGASVDVVVQIGDVAEDVDGDKILDEEASASSTGFLFNDSGNGVVLLVGGGPKGEGNERKDTEDLDGDRFLQTLDGLLVSGTAETALGTATGWRIARRLFSSDDRKNLRRSRAIRVYVSAGAAAAKGRLLIDKLFLAGSTFAVTASTDGTTAVREVAERLAAFPPAKSLEETFRAVVRDVFHAGGETQDVLEIQTGTSQEWTVRGFTTTGTEGARYGEVVHYLRVRQWNPGAPLAFALLDDEGKGIRWSFTPTASDAWHEVRVDTEKRRLTIDGSVPTGASVTVDSHRSLVQFLILSQGGNGSNGWVYVDELHMASPIGSIGAAVGVDTELRVPGPLVRVGGVPVVSDLRVREIASTVTPGFSPLYGRPTPAWGGSSRTELGMALPASQLDTHFVVDWTDAEATIGGGHTLQTIVGPVSVLDRFDLRAPGPSAAFDRESRVRVAPVPGTAFDAGALAATSEDRLTQTWTGTITSAAGRARGSLVTDLGLSTLDYVHRERGYFDSWVLGYRLYAPVTAPLLERTSRAALELALEPMPVGLTLQLTPSTRSVPLGDGREQRDGLTARLAAPMALDDRGTILTASYQREMEITATQTRVGGFDADWTEFAADLAAQSYLTSGIPLWELYASDEDFQEASADATSALYKPQVQLELERRPGSRIAHLFIPTRLDASVARDLEKEGALFSSLYVYSIAYQTNAINLFGRLGAYPTFSFYDLDEISNSISLALSYDRNETLQSGDIRLDSLVGLEGGAGNQFTVSNRLSITGTTFDNVENTTSASYTWFVRPEGGVPLPLLGKDITREAFYAHDESLELTTTWGSRPATGLVRHRTEIRIPGHGYIAATAALGVDFEKFRAASGYGYDRVTRFAAQGGIEALIRFGSGEPRREREPAPRRAQEGRPP